MPSADGDASVREFLIFCCEFTSPNFTPCFETSNTPNLSIVIDSLTLKAVVAISGFYIAVFLVTFGYPISPYPSFLTHFPYPRGALPHRADPFSARMIGFEAMPFHPSHPVNLSRRFERCALVIALQHVATG